MFPQLIDQCVERFSPFARAAGERAAMAEERVVSRLDAIYRALTENEEAYSYRTIPFATTLNTDTPKIGTVPRGEVWLLEVVTFVGDATNVAVSLFDDKTALSQTVLEASPRWGSNMASVAFAPVTTAGNGVRFLGGSEIYLKLGTGMAICHGWVQIRRETVESRHPRPSTPGAAVLRPTGAGYRTETERHATMNGHSQVPVTGL